MARVQKLNVLFAQPPPVAEAATPSKKRKTTETNAAEKKKEEEEAEAVTFGHILKYSSSCYACL